eukprot:TRINITY_DN104461_c0_g1_i1.p1 TRINITY_DN104461_c0_g1~~TRINITY_DN104461_c0_g1_i1.p1  ORF type:complete len:335 (+),score=8.12 TRINITY_DN104461_c0_g1_i1:227-1231(+)
MFRWFKRYALCVTACSVAAFLVPWLFVACPGQHVAGMYVVLRGSVYCMYWCSQVCLAYLSVHRLMLMKQDRVAWLCGVLARLLLCSVCVVIACAVLGLPAWAVVVFMVASVLFYIIFQICVTSALLQASFMAFQEARIATDATPASRNTAATLLIGIASALSSVTTVVSNSLGAVIAASYPTLPLPLLSWSYHFASILDHSSDALFATVCVGVICPSLDALTATGNLVEAARRRQVLSALTEAARAVTGPSVTLAALFEGREPDELLRAAVERFRCIDWDTLRHHSYSSLQEVRWMVWALQQTCMSFRNHANLGHATHFSLTAGMTMESKSGKP